MRSNILDDFAALHNYKQAEGLNPVTNQDLTNYLLEQRLIRTMQEAANAEDITVIAFKARLGPQSVMDAIEDYCYRMRTEDLHATVKILEQQGLYEALRFMCLEAEYE